MSTRIMYSALGSCEIQPTTPLSKDNNTAPKNKHKEEHTIPKASRPAVASVPKSRQPWDLRPASYVRPAINATIDEQCTEPRLLYPYYRPSMRFHKEHPYHEDYYAECTAQEIKRCEQISHHPHPNLAQYLGVKTRNFNGGERVTRIAYKQYSMDLHAFVLEKKLLKLHHVLFLLDEIKAGMEALHAMELVHCDVRPMNIFVTVGKHLNKAGNAVLKEVVLGDFDASLKVGEEIKLKRASRDWRPEDAEYGMKAATWVDEWCLEKLQEWLKGDWRKNTKGLW
ncbi:hypothetical protein E8E11_003215 [Didymella keratinophila]|nr:hypothetical protein E8E11_003215 [Didymella keratinophila]